MKYEATSPEDYIHKLPDGRRKVIELLRKTILKIYPKVLKNNLDTVC